MSKLIYVSPNHPYLTPQIARQAGISKYQFYQYLKKNNFEQINRGLYVPKDEWVDELYVLHKRYPQAVFSHDEAFYYHGLSDREAILHTLTIYSGYNARRLKAGGRCKVYTVKKDLLEIGKTTVMNDSGHELPMYNLERTICDLFRSRSSIEIQDFTTIIKAYFAHPDKDLNRLIEYAGLFRIDQVICRYLEVLL